jgi:hypothetical protein
MMLYPTDEFHCDLVYNIVLLIANIFLLRNISLDDDIVMMLSKIHKNLTKKKRRIIQRFQIKILLNKSR